jgi:hypothetical protein
LRETSHKYTGDAAPMQITQINAHIPKFFTVIDAHQVARVNQRVRAKCGPMANAAYYLRELTPATPGRSRRALSS